MNQSEFMALVAEMRQAQKSFFSAPQFSESKQRFLNTSKKLEKLVDDEIYNQMHKNQLSIFDNE
jgi:hypothetical protein